jgi:hypothetical protein
MPTILKDCNVLVKMRDSKRFVVYFTMLLSVHPFKV